MQPQTHRETFNDGFLYYGHRVTNRSASKKKIGDTFTEEGKLAFRELSSRESDYQMAELNGAKLDIKLKTPYPPSFRNINKNKLVVIIKNEEFDVIKTDIDKSKLYLFFYLQRVGVRSE